MADYAYEDKNDPDLTALCVSIDADSQIASHVDFESEGHRLAPRWDESAPESGVGVVMVRWSGDICGTCKAALDALVAAL